MRYSPFEKKKRWASRLALYGSLVVVILGIGLLGWLAVRFGTLNHQGAWEERDYLALPEVKHLSEYVRIDTSEGTGSELEGAHYLAEHLESEGIEVHIEDLGSGKANLWAILEGEKREALVLHHHIDVTPILKPDLWSFDPFGAELELPWLYGRGVFDMKSIGIAQLEAFLDLKRSGVPLERSVIFLATSSEETGSHLGVRRILKTRPELVSRFWAVLTEGGVVEAVSREEVKYWGIEFAQKRVMEAFVCSTSKERLDDLRADLLAVNERRLDLSVPIVNPEILTFTNAYAPSRGSSFNRERLADPEAMFMNGWAWSQLPEYMRSIFVDEAYPRDVVEVAEGQFELKINILLRSGSDGNRAHEELLMPWVHGLEVSIGEPIGPPHGSSPSHPLFASLARKVKETYPSASVGPYMLPWSVTDARFFRDAGIPAYGFSPFLILNTDTLQVDQPNERMSIPGFVGGVDLYREVVRSIATGE